MPLLATAAVICLLAVSNYTYQESRAAAAGVRVAGHVSGPAGEPLAGARVELVRGGVVQFTTTSDGREGSRSITCRPRPTASGPSFAALPYRRRR
jgi:hypothetical protein